MTEWQIRVWILAHLKQAGFSPAEAGKLIKLPNEPAQPQSDPESTAENADGGTSH